MDSFTLIIFLLVIAIAAMQGLMPIALALTILLGYQLRNAGFIVLGLLVVLLATIPTQSQVIILAAVVLLLAAFLLTNKSTGPEYYGGT